MIRAILCTLALTVALTAANAQAGKFKFSFGGGGHSNQNQNFHHNHHNYQQNYQHHKQYHAPVVVTPCYYQVCYTHPAGTFQKHEIFPSLYEAQNFAAKVQHLGYLATVSKYHPPQAAAVGHNWLP